MADDDLKGLLEEQLAPMGPVLIKRMFGGAGLFLDGLMFAMISDGVLYFKTDDRNRADFEREGTAQFTYMRQNRTATLVSYWQAPERLLDEPEDLLAWAKRAHAAARAQAKGKAAAAGSRRKPRAS